MAFVKHVDRRSLSKRSASTLPVRVALSSNGGSKLPVLKIVFRASFAAEAQVKEGHLFDLLIGTGEDAGVVQVVRADDGACAPRISKHLVLLRFVHVEQFGTTLHKAEWCAAEIIKDNDVGAIEITLPSWAAELKE